MANALPRRLITPRDLELLAALDYGPLTARQLQKISTTWSVPFGSARSVRDRLQRLAHVKLISGHPYAILHPGQPEHYYLPTRSGFQLVHGPDMAPPTRGYFLPIGLARQPHQRAIADFVVHTICGAHLAGVQFTGFYRENAIRLTAGGDSVYPDFSFVLVRGEETYRFYGEIDNGTERVRSMREADSIERKLRTYDAFQNKSPEERFRVLFISARGSQQRVSHILETAQALARDPNRTLCYGITLAQYLSRSHPVTALDFLDQRGRRQSLLPDIPVASLLRQSLVHDPVPC